MICLNSKVYHIWKNDESLPADKRSKTSCKGTQKKRNDIIKQHFISLLATTEPAEVENAGFVNTVDGIKTYRQSKRGLSYFYAKRKVLSDGVTTTHLYI